MGFINSMLTEISKGTAVILLVGSGGWGEHCGGQRFSMGGCGPLVALQVFFFFLVLLSVVFIYFCFCLFVFICLFYVFHVYLPLWYLFRCIYLPLFNVFTLAWHKTTRSRILCGDVPAFLLCVVHSTDGTAQLSVYVEMLTTKGSAPRRAWHLK